LILGPVFVIALASNRGLLRLSEAHRRQTKFYLGTGNIYVLIVETFCLLLNEHQFVVLEILAANIARFGCARKEDNMHIFVMQICLNLVYVGKDIICVIDILDLRKQEYSFFGIMERKK
jgi:hypothetical protein